MNQWMKIMLVAWQDGLWGEVGVRDQLGLL